MNINQQYKETSYTRTHQTIEIIYINNSSSKIFIGFRCIFKHFYELLIYTINLGRYTTVVVHILLTQPSNEIIQHPINFVDFIQLQFNGTE